MFLSFFYHLRGRGLGVSVDEWLLLLEALHRGLVHSSFTDFYYLCRCVLVKSEKDFDAFDAAFLDYFQEIADQGEVPEEFLEWLENGRRRLRQREELNPVDLERGTTEEMLRRFQELLEIQKEEHNGGRIWVGTGGYSPFGNSGRSPQGVRVDGHSQYRSAFQVAGERRFRDFTQTAALDNRQLQLAFRKLRQFSKRVDAERLEFDVDGTVRQTCDSGGTLRIAYQKPRRNTVKLLLLMDSGGSMEAYSTLCGQLFHAARQARHLRDLQVYYFHNTVYANVFSSPTLRRDSMVPSEWLLQNLDSGYKLILVGDGTMEPSELLNRPWRPYRERDESASVEWLNRYRARFPHCVWLNPLTHPPVNAYWGQTYFLLAQLFDMYPLTLQGLDQAFHRLLAGR